MFAFALIIVFVLAEATASIHHDAIFQSAGKETLGVISSIFLPCGDQTSRTDDDLPCLHAAIFADNVEACEFLIEEKGVDVNVIGKDGGTALMYATAANNLRLVKLLLKSGADVNYKAQDGICSLHIAARYGYADVFKALLLESGKGVKVKAKDNYQCTIYHHAAKGGHVEIIEIISQTGFHWNQQDKNGDTPLRTAIKEGHIDAALALIGVGSHHLGTSCHKELRLATQYGRKSVLMALLTAGCGLEEKDENGNTVLMNAIDFPPSNVVHEYVVACAKSVEIVQTLILAGADVGAVNKAGKNALNIAMERKNYAAYAIISKELSIAASRKYAAQRIFPSIHFEITEKYPNLERIRRLLHGGKDERDHLKRTAAHMAVESEHVHIVEELISAGCDLTLKDGAGNTVMFLAKSAEMARVLMKGDENLSYILNEEGNTPLHTHILKKREEVACVLACDKKAVVTYNRLGYSALDFASKVGNVVIAECLLKNGANEQIFLKRNPLHVCADNGDAEMTTFFVNYGFEIHVRDDGDTLPAHYAAMNDGATLDMIRLLMKDVEHDTTDMFGLSLLHSAVLSGNRDKVKMMVEEYGVPLNLLTFTGRTALIMAIKFGHVDISIDLINYGADVMLTRPSGKTTLYYAVWYSSEKRLPIISPLVHAHRNLKHVKITENETILDMLIGWYAGRLLHYPKTNKYVVELELTPEDVKMHPLINVLRLQSISFKKFLKEMTEPILFVDYVERAIKELKKDNGIPDNTTLEENVKGGFGNCYAFAAAYYPELASKEVPETETERLNSKKGEYREAAKAYEELKNKPFYITKLRYMLVESFFRGEGRNRMFGTYMNFVPPELVDDVLIGVTNNNNVLERMDLLANALMLTLRRKEEMDDHNAYLWGKINGLSDVIIPK